MDELFNVSIRRTKAHPLPDIDKEIRLLRWSVQDFALKRIIPNVHNKRVLEIGPATHPQGHAPEYFVNIKEKLLEQGNEYTSLDIVPNSGADIICDVVNLLNHVDKWSFDVIIGLEVLEHVRQLWKVPGVFFDVLDHKGKFYTSSPFYFVHHDPKPDYWRVSEDGYRALFGDLFKLDVEKFIIEDNGNRPLNIRVTGSKR
jgi:hypothetical protein